MLSETDVLIIISCVGFSVLSFVVLVLRSTIQKQEVLLSEALSQIREFVLASLAFKASAGTHPMTGPAVLQQLSKMNNKPLLAPEEKIEPKKTGVTVSQGTNR